MNIEYSHEAFFTVDKTIRRGINLKPISDFRISIARQAKNVRLLRRPLLTLTVDNVSKQVKSLCALVSLLCSFYFSFIALFVLLFSVLLFYNLLNLQIKIGNQWNVCSA